MNYSEKYNYTPDPLRIASSIESIIADADSFASTEVYKSCFSFMDLTTLQAQDTVESVSKLVSKVIDLCEEYPSYPLPASICVYPNFASVVKDKRPSPELHVTTVAGCFPSSQSFLEVKIRECELAVETGAEEIDIVLALNSFFAGDYETAYKEIRSIKAAIDAAAKKQDRTVILKVILETGLLVSPEKIADASFLAMEAGADFIKTSTGKVEVNATPTSAYVMCECIKAFHEKTGRKVGFKAAGGISNAKDALCYYCIGNTILGKEWMNKDLFRFGVSRLGNSLMSAIEQRTINFF